jgi:putative membrane protein insertion efficiency factor
MNWLVKKVWLLPGTLLIVAARVYQLTLSPLIGRHCRFEPTCSAYFIQAVEKYGAVRGAWRGIKRIGRCHPFQPGGYDPP